MKTHKTLSPLQWLVTLFMCLFLLHPSRACVAAPDPCQFSNHAIVPVNQITNIVPIVNYDNQPADEKGKLLGPIIFFAIMLAVAAYIVYQLCKLLDKVIPPNPPPPPPSGTPTNSPPIVINPTHGPGQITVADVSAVGMPSNTNRNWGTLAYYDISQLNYLNTCEKFQGAYVFDGFWSTGMMISTNIVDWEDTHYRIDCYVCTPIGGVFYAYYHYETNWYNCYYTGAYVTTNHAAPAYFDLTDKPHKPQQYFKLNPK